MLTLSYKKDETFTLLMADGTVVHGCIESVSPGLARIVWCAPQSVRIQRDTASAEKAYQEVRSRG